MKNDYVCYILTIDIRARRTRKVNHDTRDILRLAQPLPRIRVLKLLLPTQQLNQAIRKLRRKEARRDGVGRDVARAEFHGELPREMVGSSLGDAVHDGAMVAHVRDRGTGSGGDDDDARGVLSRARLFEQRREASTAISS
jgi:hypothetical protein